MNSNIDCQTLNNRGSTKESGDALTSRSHLDFSPLTHKSLHSTNSSHNLHQMSSHTQRDRSPYTYNKNHRSSNNLLNYNAYQHQSTHSQYQMHNPVASNSSSNFLNIPGSHQLSQAPSALHSAHQQQVEPSKQVLQQTGSQPFLSTFDHLQEQRDKLESENHDLKKQFRLKESEHHKTRAVLEQQVTLLQMQVQESQEREDNLKKVTEKMLKAFDSGSSGQSGATHQQAELIKELQIQNDLQRAEVSDIKHRHQDQIRQYEKLLEEGRIVKEQSQRKCKILEDKLEQLKFEYDHQNIENVLRIKELELKLDQLTEERMRLVREIDSNQQRFKQSIDYFSNEKKKISYEQSKLQQLQRSDNKNTRSNTKMIRDLEKELESVKLEQDIMISGIQQNYDVEKRKLEQKIQKLETQFNQNFNSYSQNGKNTVTNNNVRNSSSKNYLKQQQIQEMQQKYLTEIQELNNNLTTFKTQTQVEVNLLQEERDDLLKKIQAYEEEIQALKLKNKLKREQNLNQSSSKQSQNDSNLKNDQKALQACQQKYKLKVQQLKSSVQKLEQNERKLKNLLIDKENEYEQEIIEIKRLLNTEKKRVKELQDQLFSLQSNYERLQSDVFHQVKEKDKKLSMLNHTVQDLQSQLNATQNITDFNQNNRLQNLDFSPEPHLENCQKSQFTRNLNDPQAQQDYNSEQQIILANRILDSCLEIMCFYCRKTYDNGKLFYNHLLKCHPHESCDFNYIKELANEYFDQKGAYQEQQMPHQNLNLIYDSLDNQSHNTSILHKVSQSDSEYCLNQQIFDSNQALINNQHFQQQNQSNQQPLIDKLYYLFEQNKHLSQKLQEQQDLIRNLHQQIEGFEREKLKEGVDYDKIELELKRTKIELAMCEERKSESEQCYKNEIKYLIDKLLKTKNKLQKQRNSAGAIHKKLEQSDETEDESQIENQMQAHQLKRLNISQSFTSTSNKRCMSLNKSNRGTSNYYNQENGNSNLTTCLQTGSMNQFIQHNQNQQNFNPLSQQQTQSFTQNDLLLQQLNQSMNFGTTTKAHQNQQRTSKSSSKGQGLNQSLTLNSTSNHRQRILQELEQQAVSQLRGDQRQANNQSHSIIQRNAKQLNTYINQNINPQHYQNPKTLREKDMNSVMSQINQETQKSSSSKVSLNYNQNIPTKQHSQQQQRHNFQKQGASNIITNYNQNKYNIQSNQGQMRANNNNKQSQIKIQNVSEIQHQYYQSSDDDSDKLSPSHWEL
eukprot:403368185